MLLCRRRRTKTRAGRTNSEACVCARCLEGEGWGVTFSQVQAFSFCLPVGVCVWVRVHEADVVSSMESAPTSSRSTCPEEFPPPSLSFPSFGPLLIAGLPRHQISSYSALQAPPRHTHKHTQPRIAAMQRSLAVAASRSGRGTRHVSACTVRLAADSSRSMEELQRKLTPAEQGESIRQQCRSVSMRQSMQSVVVSVSQTPSLRPPPTQTLFSCSHPHSFL